MATVKHGTMTPSPGFAAWWKHLRPYAKRQFWKRERRIAKRVAKQCAS